MLNMSAKPRLRTLLEHFAVIGDPRQSCKVMYPLREVILLVVCATIAVIDTRVEHKGVKQMRSLVSGTGLW